MNWIKCSDKIPPKDGTNFLGYGKDSLHEEYEYMVMTWYEGGEDYEGYNIMEGFFAITQWGYYNREHSCNPLYWMPLPPPPKVEE